MSIPLAKTRCAASGSAQMLNSAAGVRLPSPIEPPIRTIRSGRASGCSASSSATFVSGPVGTSVSLPSRRADLVGEEVDRMLGPRGAARRRQVGAVEAGLAVHVRRDVALAHERPVGARVDRDVAAARELEHAQRVRRRLVERLVAGDGRDADELELGRGEREQERDRVVVTGVAVEDDRRRSHAASIASTSAAVGRDGCAPSRDAASAPAAHARRSASSRGAPLEQRDDEAGGERVAGRGAVDGVDPRRRRRARPRARPRRAPRPPRRSVTATSLPRETTSCSSRLTISRSGSRSIGRAGAAFSAKNVARRAPPRARPRRAPRAGRAPRRRGDAASTAAFAPGTTTIWFSPSSSTRISATPVVAGALQVELDAGAPARPGERLVGERRRRRPRRPSGRPRRAAPRRPPGSRPCRRGSARSRAPATVSPGRGSRSTRATRSRLIDPTTVSSTRHRRGR